MSYNINDPYFRHNLDIFFCRGHLTSGKELWMVSFRNEGSYLVCERHLFRWDISIPKLNLTDERKVEKEFYL